METVWLKDVTTTTQTDKRTLSDHGLPAQLTFHLMRGSGVLTLTLKRNYDIDPNADIYAVQRTKDGRSILSKTRNLEQEEGNIEIGDSSYVLRPAEASDTSENTVELPDMIGKRYILLDHRNIGVESFVGNEDELRETFVQGELQPMLRRITGQEKENHVLFRNNINAILQPRNVGNLHNSGTMDKSRQLKEEYHVKVAVLIDSSVWNLYVFSVH
ncbi:hypothetical protein CHS0354_016944 [Potamilus streckersoni]|uniref:Uncharacterized protein n=1 Tax=Potamilus streckersoni TaxID=2493646 RepID=A0AAE0VQS7_9BIVA|nr:hypothetical protein CHS0354_016944 [Potamilus streckersoni]